MLSIVVVPRSGTMAVDGLINGALRFKVAAPPVDGKANDALLRYLQRVTGISRGRIVIVSGATGRNKRVRFDGVSFEELIALLTTNMSDSQPS